MLTLNDLKNLDGDSLLERLGLQRRETGGWVLPAVAGAVLGLAAGAALAFFASPQGEALGGTAKRWLQGEDEEEDASDDEGLASPPQVGASKPRPEPYGSR